MTQWIPPLLVVGFIAWMIPVILKSRYEFTIVVKHGNAHRQAGRVTAAFVAAVSEICQTSGIERGWVGGVRREKIIGLRFSHEFPRPVQQRIRNEWQIAR